MLETFREVPLMHLAVLVKDSCIAIDLIVTELAFLELVVAEVSADATEAELVVHLTKVGRIFPDELNDFELRIEFQFSRQD